MNLTLRLNSLEEEDPFFNDRQVRGERLRVVPDKTEVLSTHTATLIPVSGGTYLTEAVFAGLEPGQYRFTVSHEGRFLWRSGLLELGAEDREMRFDVMSVRGVDVTQTKDMLTGQMMAEVPIVSSAQQGVSDANATQITVISEIGADPVGESGLHLTGRGYHGARSLYEGAAPGAFHWGVEFNFTYDVDLAPSNHPDPSHLLRVIPLGPVDITFHSPVIDFFAGAQQNRIDRETRATIEEKLNEQMAAAIRQQLQIQTSDQELIARSTAVVDRIVTTVGNPDVTNRIEFRLLVSVPFELIQQQTQSPGGCFGVAAILALTSAAILAGGITGLVHFLA